MNHSIHGRIQLTTAIVFGALIGWGGLAAAAAEPAAEKTAAAPKAVRNSNASDRAQGVDGAGQKKPAVTPAQIRDALVQAAAKLVDLKMVVVERGDFVVRSPTMPMPVPIVFKEVWMHGRSAQVRMDFRDDDQKTQPWWTGFKSLNHPVTTADLASVSGVKECVDLSRELVFADSRGPATTGRVSKSPHFISNLFVPLVECDKPWIATRLRGGLTVADQLLEQPVAHWHVLGDETMGGEEAILVEIAQNDTFTIPLKGHAGGLSMTQGYLAWFSKMHGLMPLRIEQTMRYGYGGREYRLERRPDGMAPLVYVAADFVRFRDVWVPRGEARLFTCPKNSRPQNRRSLILMSWSTSWSLREPRVFRARGRSDTGGNGRFSTWGQSTRH